MKATLTELVAEGFEPLTCWLLVDGKINPETTSWDTGSGWIYAFVVGRKVKYIGQTSRILRARLSEYSHMTDSYSGGRGQPDRLRGRILDAIGFGSDVAIYGLRHPGDDKAREQRQNELIRRFKPSWNNYIPTE